MTFSKDQIELMDQQVAERITADCMSGDNEGDHSAADDILIAALGKLGMFKTIKAWEEVGKWYA